MEEKELEKLRYPIGLHDMSKEVSENDVREFIGIIENFPGRLRRSVEGLNDEQLDTRYREGGWTVRQVVHHVADSHVNSYVRFKWTLTEDRPAVKAYYEDRWAELPDGKGAPVEASLSLLDAIHNRWVILLKSLSMEDLKKKFEHPESGEIILDRNIGLYAWHCDHHLAHIEGLKERKGW